MEIVRHENWKSDKNPSLIADNNVLRRTCGETLSPLKKLNTSSSTRSPALDLFRNDLVMVYKTELKQAHSKVKGFTSLTQNYRICIMRAEAFQRIENLILKERYCMTLGNLKYCAQIILITFMKLLLLSRAIRRNYHCSLKTDSFVTINCC